MLGDLYTPAQRADAEKKFPDWSPVRHMTMDAPQRAAVRDLLALATAIDGIMIMPRLHCFCDRYWNFLSRCRFPIGPRDMPIPWTCPQDALYDVQRWNKKKVRFREAAFLENLPEAGHIGVLSKLKANTVRVRVAARRRRRQRQRRAGRGGRAVGVAADGGGVGGARGEPRADGRDSH